MKTHKNLKELLEAYTEAYFERCIQNKTNMLSEFIDDFVASNSLNQAEPETVTNNKGNGNKPKCICNEIRKLGGGGYCSACKTDWV